MPLKRRLILYLVVPALLLLVVGLVGLLALTLLERAASAILSDNYRTIREAHRLEGALLALEWPLEARSGRAAGQRDEELTSIVERSLALCEENITEQAERRIIDDIRSAWALAAPRLRAATAGARMTPTERAAVLTPLVEGVDELVRVNEDAMAAFERRQRRIARLMLAIVAIASALAILALGIFAQLAASRISRPILAVADDLHRALERSDDTGAEAAGPEDEIARLRRELDELLARLRSFELEHTRQYTLLRDRFAFVLEEVHEGLVLLDADLEIRALNAIARRILGISEGDESRRHNLREVGATEQVRALLSRLPDGAAAVPAELEESREILEIDSRFYSPRLLPIGSAEEQAEGFLLVLWDVTEERRFEKSRRSFIGMLSHQLKTPLTSLSMSTNLLRERFHGRSPEADDLLDMACGDCRALSHLIAELIDASRDVTPTLSVRTHRTDLVRILRASLRPFGTQAAEKEIDLRDEMGAEAVFAHVDPVKFPWVVSNIVGNALRYTPPRGAVTVRLDAAPGRIRVIVSDTGAGIAQEDLPRVFQPFTTLDSDPEPATHGLGLAIAKEIIDAHGGTLRVESALGRGTAFTIELPMGAGTDR